ncbi:MAG TPA: transglycosylase domain-containing protein [Candidatus Limnocylindria bacterium]|nr:transglycosylase domain-containing protein [Candidatus Limnocylindria bacterium]
MIGALHRGAVRPACATAAIALAVLLTGTLAYARFAPLDAPETRLALPGTVVLDASGAVLERDARAGFRIPVTLAQVAPRMLQATISAEDRRFLAHTGVDPIAVTRALLTLRDRPSGASTITQQLARRLYLPDDARAPLLRKADEARIALQLEANRSKADILTLYLNDVYYGRGAYGVEAAARVYFGTSARNLDLAHAAYLAGLPQRPSDLSEESALARQRYVIDRMVEDGWIGRAAADAALARPITVRPALEPPIAHHFVTLARRELSRVRPDLAARDGLVIETTLDAGLQLELERLARLRLETLTDRNVTDAAVVAIEPGTGRILALVGGATDGDERHGGKIDMATTPRQPGSALKPFLYAAAFERGYTAATALLDVPTTFETQDAAYAPLNYDRTFRGLVSLRTALASSLNVPAVRTLDAVGLEAMLATLHRVGLGRLTQADRYGLSLSLGGGEVSLLELTNAYAAIGSGGQLVEGYAVTRVRDGAGHVLYERGAPVARRALSAEHAYLLADILSDPDARIAGFGAFTPFDLPFPAAVKSGTTTGYRDNWTIGTTPTLAIGVWVGNADASPMRDVSGVVGAAPLWQDAMLAAALSRPMAPFIRPPGIVTATVCAPTGLRPGPACPSPVRELFVAGTEPAQTETYYVRGADGALRVDPPLEARAWARDAGLLLAETSGARDVLLRIVTPPAGSIYHLSPELPDQQVILRASASAALKRIWFSVDGVAVGEADAQDARVTWVLVPGMHVVRVVGLLSDGTTTAVSAPFEVR